MMTLIKSGTGAFAVCVALATTSQAATVTFGATPAAAFANPLADSITGTVFENVTGSVKNVRRSPWQGSSVDENAADAFYSSISGGATATFEFAERMGSVSFLWGSPDVFNDLDIILSGGGGTTTINGAAAQGPVGREAQFVTISDVGSFDTLVFRSGTNAFEFANLQVLPVPLPAALPMLFVGLGALGLAARRRHRAST